jgi:hypothetical protein
MTRKTLGLAIIATVSISACGLENLFGTLGRAENARPASTIQGFFPWAGPKTTQIFVTDGGGTTVVPFDTFTGQDLTLVPAPYQLKLPSSQYSMIQVHARLGDLESRSIVPSVGVESAVSGADLDARNLSESIIVEANLSANGTKFSLISPEAYEGTRKLIRADFDKPGPTKDVLTMVGNLMSKAEPQSGSADPYFARVPVLDASYVVKTSPLDPGWIARNPFDYVGNGVIQTETVALDTALAAAAKLYKPNGCVDTSRIRLMFTVDFSQGALDGNCNAVDRFKWAVDKPGKRMFFVGWVHKDSPVQDTAINAQLGASVPNLIPMYDDGTNGDEVAGDGIWTVFFDVPLDPAKTLRVGYKYTWGTQGAQWTGSEEWPGNSRILEVVDVNGDGFVSRRDVFGDESTNKDNSNLNTSGKGSINWTTELPAGCGPASHEQKVTLHSACKCDQWITPKAIGPITVPCTG